MTCAAFRTGTKTHTQRPSKSEQSARMAWNAMASDGPIKDMKLVDGLWMCMRPDGSLENIDASAVRQYVDMGWEWGKAPDEDMRPKFV
jgi:hypothetical protein